ncbi:MAG: DUF1043 family protein [Pseudomonadaceae bacterium]|nr:DUF1043 family protein [Pseudomonadaceae bacterium]
MVIEWVVGIAVISMLVGVALGYYLPLGNAKKARVSELETALDSAQQELADYKSEVFSQFATTAEKFRNLDESYQALHQQLARSSVDLCGDAATPLLSAATVSALTEESSDAAAQDNRFSEEDLDAQTPDVDENATNQSKAHDIEDEILVAEASAGLQAGVTQEDVPTLTERDADFTSEVSSEVESQLDSEDAEPEAKRERA